MKRAFTLIEVNLAIMVMAVGILGIISLYSFGYREERQSREDVASASYADAVMGPLVTALTATNVKWSVFRKIQDSPGRDGWGHYVQNRNTGKAYNDTLSALNFSGADWSMVSGNQPLKAALVVMHDEDSAVVRISFRATEKANFLFAAPLYYTEARFQGVMDE